MKNGGICHKQAFSEIASSVSSMPSFSNQPWLNPTLENSWEVRVVSCIGTEQSQSLHISLQDLHGGDTPSLQANTCHSPFSFHSSLAPWLCLLSTKELQCDIPPHLSCLGKSRSQWLALTTLLKITELSTLAFSSLFICSAFKNCVYHLLKYQLLCFVSYVYYFFYLSPSSGPQNKLIGAFFVYCSCCFVHQYV